MKKNKKQKTGNIKYKVGSHNAPDIHAKGGACGNQDFTYDHQDGVQYKNISNDSYQSNAYNKTNKCSQNPYNKTNDITLANAGGDDRNLGDNSHELHYCTA